MHGYHTRHAVGGCPLFAKVLLAPFRPKTNQFSSPMKRSRTLARNRTPSSSAQRTDGMTPRGDPTNQVYSLLKTRDLLDKRYSSRRWSWIKSVCNFLETTDVTRPIERSALNLRNTWPTVLQKQKWRNLDKRTPRIGMEKPAPSAIDVV